MHVLENRQFLNDIKISFKCDLTNLKFLSAQSSFSDPELFCFVCSTDNHFLINKYEKLLFTILTFQLYVYIIFRSCYLYGLEHNMVSLQLQKAQQYCWYLAHLLTSFLFQHHSDSEQLGLHYLRCVK